MAPPALHGVFCTTKIPDEVLKNFLASAVTGAPPPDFTPTLCVVTHLNLESYTNDDVSHPHTIARFETPFNEMNESDIAALLAQNGRSKINTDTFIVLDKRSCEDESVLLVSGCGDEEGLQTVRVGFGQALAILQAVDVRSIGMEEVRSWVDESGVYRGSNSVPKKGSAAPRKQLE